MKKFIYHLSTNLHQHPSFIERLSVYLDNCKNNNKEIHIVIGDTHINLMANTDMTNTYLNALSAHGFFFYINKMTSYSSGTCIDHSKGYPVIKVKSLGLSELKTQIYEENWIELYSSKDIEDATKIS